MKKNKRRDFLKISGAGALAGVGLVTGLIEKTVVGSESPTQRKTTKEKIRWGMVIGLLIIIKCLKYLIL